MDGTRQNRQRLGLRCGEGGRRRRRREEREGREGESREAGESKGVEVLAENMQLLPHFAFLTAQSSREEVREVGSLKDAAAGLSRPKGMTKYPNTRVPVHCGTSCRESGREGRKTRQREGRREGGRKGRRDERKGKKDREKGSEIIRKGMWEKERGR